MNKEEILQKVIEKYGVDSNGEVWHRRTNRKLKLSMDHKGYKYFFVYLGEGKTKKILVHRFVAYNFIPNPNNYPQVNHKDGNRLNNFVGNLEWCDAQWNVSDGFKRGRIIWNKGKYGKSQIYRLCKKYPRQIFWILTKNDFQFAKAFWGEEPMSIGDYEGITYQNGGGDFKEIFKPAWQYHLQQMVLEEDPVSYIEKFL